MHPKILTNMPILLRNTGPISFSMNLGGLSTGDSNS